MKIGILGGGVGGLSAAIALKLKGFDVDVYERHDATSEIGAGIVCWPNAGFVLEQLGLLEQVKMVAGPLNRMNRYCEQGDSLGELDITELNRLTGYSSYAILRRDLMRALLYRVNELNVPVHYGCEAAELSETKNSSVQVKFKNELCIAPDLVIGAEGRMNSISRSYVNGTNNPIYQGFINWIGVYESNEPLFPELSVGDYWGVGQRFGVVPVSNHKAYWAGAVTANSIQKKNPKEYRQELEQIFSEWPGVIPKLIAETPETQINKIYVHDHDPIDKWHKNNVVLIGDAAHAALPTSGQGACQALEDSWHLAECVAEARGNLEQALPKFTQIRAEKTKAIIQGGRNIASSIFNDDPIFCQQRNEASKNTDFHSAAKGMAELWLSGLPRTSFTSI